MDEYKDGLYEKVISQRLGRKLQQALDNQEIWATISDRVDPQEAVGYLSDYIRKLVHLCLKDLADQNGDSLLEQELALTNGLVGYLTEKAPALAADSQVDREDFLLLELQHRLNHLKETHRPRPATSLSHSFLFTNSQKDVSMVSELRREIASSDRIDFLVSFIKFSGLTLILPYLRTFTVAGGHLRVLTTTYMGATDPKAIELLSQLPNTEVRISYNVKETRLHAKAYLFQRNSGYSTAYVGSSNLSHAAIADGLEWNMKVTQQDMPEIMAKLIELLNNLPSFESQKAEPIVLKWIEDNGFHLGNVMNAFRLAVVGECKGPHMFDITELLGPEETIRRIQKAIDTIPAPASQE